MQLASRSNSSTATSLSSLYVRVRLTCFHGGSDRGALLRSSAGRALRSASAIVCKPVTGSHVLRVDGYSHLTQAISKEQSVRSSAFDVGGHSWRIALYPNGDNLSKLDGHIGVFLRLDSAPPAGGVWARPQFSVHDQLGNPCSVRTARLCTFKQRGYMWGFADFIGKEILEKPEYLRDDSFAIQCDVAVTTVTERPDHMVFVSANAEPGAP